MHFSGQYCKLQSPVLKSVAECDFILNSTKENLQLFGGCFETMAWPTPSVACAGIQDKMTVIVMPILFSCVRDVDACYYPCDSLCLVVLGWSIIHLSKPDTINTPLTTFLYTHNTKMLSSSTFKSELLVVACFSGCGPLFYYYDSELVNCGQTSSVFLLRRLVIQIYDTLHEMAQVL
ncbi:hypothetical protein CPC08DRAFT_561023 [Agrocybe pediades]|nr:hypothetical protein CPC08DRAFT_561023 [Agrocybe pediades]